MATTDSKPRILWVANWQVNGGISTVTGHFMQDPRIHARFLVKVQDQSFPGVWNEHPILKALKLPRGIFLILWHCLRFKPDIVHIQTPFDRYGFIKDGLIALLAKKLGGKTVLTFQPGNSLLLAYQQAPTWLKNWTHFVLPRCDALVALGPTYQEFLETRFHHPRVVVIPNPVDDEMVNHQPADYLQRDHIALFVGLFTTRKGILDFIQAADHVALPSARFIIKGGERTPHETRTFEQAIATCQAKPRIQIEPWGPVSETLARSRVLVLPSYGESLPLILAEAMACGLPVITTPVGVIPDYIQDGVHGLLVAPGDIQALAKAIETMLSDPTRAAAIAQSNRICGQVFLRSQVHALLIQLYEELLCPTAPQAGQP